MTEAPDLDAEFVFDRPLGGDELKTLGDLLARHAPHWTRRLRIFRSADHDVAVDIRTPGALAGAVQRAAAERGPTYAKLVETFGQTEDHGQGSAELRGATRALFVIVSLDERVFSRIAGRGHLGNEIALQVRARVVEKQPAEVWLRQVFSEMCERFSPAWAAAYTMASTGPR